MPTIILRCWWWPKHKATMCGILIIQEPCQTDFHLQPCPAPWTQTVLSSCINISVTFPHSYCAGGYPVALTCHILDPEMKVHQVEQELVLWFIQSQDVSYKSTAVTITRMLKLDSSHTLQFNSLLSLLPTNRFIVWLLLKNIISQKPP